MPGVARFARASGGAEGRVMTRSIALLALLASFLVVASASARPAARHPHKPTCATAGTTVVANGRVRVYVRPKQVDAVNDFSSPAYFVCWKPKHRRAFLGWKEDCTYPGGTAGTFRLRR